MNFGVPLLLAIFAVLGCSLRRAAPVEQHAPVSAEPAVSPPVAATVETAEPPPDEIEEMDDEPERDVISAAGLAGSVARPKSAPPRHAFAERVVKRARSIVGVRSLRKVDRMLPDDCTGFVRWVYERLGVPLMTEGEPGDNGVAAIWRRARKIGAVHQRQPRPGDLVFFRETYDKNRDGVRNDGLTHIGVVDRVAANGTVTFVHRSSTGVTRSKFNPRYPSLRTSDRGEVLNDYLRARATGPRAYLAGELFAGYASARAMKR